VPRPERRTDRAFADRTPSFDTLDTGHLLAGTGFRLFDRPNGNRIRVQLDFSRRDAVDRATWDAAASRFRPMATIHPFDAAHPMHVGTPDHPEGWWFDAGPQNWDPAWIVEQLCGLGDCGVAVLPELSLPAPDALADHLVEHHASMPSLVVAGSAHVAGTELLDGHAVDVRSNECNVYVDGAPLMQHRKIHPFQTKSLGKPYVWSTPHPEGLTNEPRMLTIACGNATRLAVVICADLNDSEIPQLLQHLCVNVLLVPAYTTTEGAFAGALSGIASQCQGLAVVANGAQPRRRRRGPFQVLLALPRAKSQIVSSSSRSDGRTVGRVDVHAVRKRDMVTWAGE